MGHSFCSLFTRRIAPDRLAELLAALEEALFALVRLLQRPEELFVLFQELLHGFFADHALVHGQEV